MRVVVQNGRTGEFLDENGKWQPNFANAREFESCGEAVIFCLDQHLSDAQVVLKFDGDSDVYIPVDDYRKLREP